MEDGEKRDIRRPMNAFLIFCKRHRSMVRERNPNMDNRSVTRILGDLWAHLDVEEKTKYTDLAKQYKDAFMKANPDYKWHNPEKISGPMTFVKPQTRPIKMKVKGEMGEPSEHTLTPGKLADPSDMGGLSMLLMAGQQSTAHRANTQEMESCDVKENKTAADHDEDCDEQEGVDEVSLTCYEKLPEDDLDQIHFCDNPQGKEEMLSPKDKVNCEREEGLAQRNSVIADQEEKPLVNASDSGEGFHSYKTLEKENPIVTCGKMVMDHIIDQLYHTSKFGHPKTTSPSKQNPANLGANGHPSTHNAVCDTFGGRSPVFENLSLSRDQLERKLLQETAVPSCSTFQSSSRCEKMTKTETGSESYNKDTFRGRKRCYSESVLTSKSDSLRNEEMTAAKLEAEVNILTQDEQNRNNESKKAVDDPDEEMYDEDQLPVRKSKRRNRGQRYQELINEGIIQPSKERLATRKTDVTAREEKIFDTKELSAPEEDLGSDVLSVYPRQIRKRTVSESERGRAVDESRRYKTGDFDLEAHIATLPACSLEKVRAKRMAARARHPSESSTKSSDSSSREGGREEEKKDESGTKFLKEDGKKEIILTMPPHLKNVNQPVVPVTGSRKRKARKHSITHLTPVTNGNQTSSATDPAEEIIQGDGTCNSGELDTAELEKKEERSSPETETVKEEVKLEMTDHLKSDDGAGKTTEEVKDEVEDTTMESSGSDDLASRTEGEDQGDFPARESDSSSEELHKGKVISDDGKEKYTTDSGEKNSENGAGEESWLDLEEAQIVGAEANIGALYQMVKADDCSSISKSAEFICDKTLLNTDVENGELHTGQQSLKVTNENLMTESKEMFELSDISDFKSQMETEEYSGLSKGNGAEFKQEDPESLSKKAASSDVSQNILKDSTKDEETGKNVTADSEVTNLVKIDSEKMDPVQRDKCGIISLEITCSCPQSSASTDVVQSVPTTTYQLGYVNS